MDKKEKTKILKAFETKIALPALVENARRVVEITAPAYRAEPEADLQAALDRWESEAPIRQTRESAKKALADIGVYPSRYCDGWVRKSGTGWAKLSLAQALDLL